MESVNRVQRFMFSHKRQSGSKTSRREDSCPASLLTPFDFQHTWVQFSLTTRQRNANKEKKQLNGRRGTVNVPSFLSDTKWREEGGRTRFGAGGEEWIDCVSFFFCMANRNQTFTTPRRDGRIGGRRGRCLLGLSLCPCFTPMSLYQLFISSPSPFQLYFRLNFQSLLLYHFSLTFK